MKWPTVIEGDPKVPFLMATTLRCWGGRYSFSWIAPIILDPYLIIQSIKERGIKSHF